MSQASRYCAHCDRKVLAQRDGPNHGLHLVMTLCTCGMWLLVWLLMCVMPRPWRCSQCGSKTYRSWWTKPVYVRRGH